MHTLNPRQRQGLLLLVIAAIGLLGVFALIASYVNDVSKRVGPMTTVLELRGRLLAYQPLTADNLAEVSVPQKWVSSTDITNPGEVLGLVSQVDLPAGERLQQQMLSQGPQLLPGQEEFPLIVDADTGVANQVDKGSLVDVIALFGANNQGSKASARQILTAVKVLSVGTSGSQEAVLLALSPQQVLQLSYAKQFAAKVTLSLISGSTKPPYATPPNYSPSQ